ncbi:MAG: hypothetical protein LBU77_05870 [Clostridiales bacterium]|jgi:hypothetical protein|nr:hypothetical protein [Clostridiales bacterium]
MTDRLFRRILAAILVIGVAATLSLVGYTVILQRNSSMITYISNER